MSKLSARGLSQDRKKVKDSGLIELGSDGYSRFFVIIKLLENIYKDSQKQIRILDVGGCSPFLADILDQSTLNSELTIVDILPKPSELTAVYLQADITKAEINENSYDVVVSTDVLEHIPVDLKEDFITACVRIAKDVVIIAAPFDTQGVDGAEHMVNEFNKQLFKVGQDWLEEHFAYGKPTINHVSQTLDNLELQYEHFGTNNLYSWTINTHLTLLNAKLGIDQPRHDQINLEYNQLIQQSVEFTSPTYRHFFVVYKDNKLVKSKILESIAKDTNPEVFTSYIHEMFVLIADRMSELKYTADRNTQKASRLEHKLHNERVHSTKLNDTLILQSIELEKLRRLRKLQILRRPMSVLRNTRNRILRKK